MKKMNITVNGTAYEVEIGDLSTSPIEVLVNGKSYSVTLEGGAPVAAAPVVRAPVPAAPVTTPAVPVVPAAAPAASASASDVRAPMPGVILDIAVKPGDKVTKGQQLLALEAMKMKNAIRSPRDAVIASVEVKDKQKVAYGDVLVRFE